MTLFKSTSNADRNGFDEQKSVHEPNDSGVATPINESESPGVKPINDASNFPDGGTKAWLNVVGGWCIFFSMFGWANGE
jgi:hypothetical protein